MDLGRKSKVAGTRRDQSGQGAVCQVVGGAQIDPTSCITNTIRRSTFEKLGMPCLQILPTGHCSEHLTQIQLPSQPVSSSCACSQQCRSKPSQMAREHMPKSIGLRETTNLSIQHCPRESNTPSLDLQDREKACKLKNSATRGTKKGRGSVHIEKV